MPTLIPHKNFPRYHGAYNTTFTTSASFYTNQGTASAKSPLLTKTPGAELLYVPTGVTPAASWRWSTNWRQYRLNGASYVPPAGGTTLSSTISGFVNELATDSNENNASLATFDTPSQLWRFPTCSITLRAPSTTAIQFTHVAFFMAQNKTDNTGIAGLSPVCFHIATYQEDAPVILAASAARAYGFRYSAGWRTR